MEQNEIISGIMQDIRELFAADSSGHDIDHMMRVYRTARRIAEAEGGGYVYGICGSVYRCGKVKDQCQDTEYFEKQFEFLHLFCFLHFLKIIVHLLI